ncbi:DNA polymerase III subunit delta' [Vibrio sp. Of14-4]|uniref:DNA polymerase III subunit delta' n=1 Tax=Vibrio sp. Of14-4 TaxID=2724878 RepID=UPI001EF259F7|nr:DNA polymerase III subunit delta' [Vibrio sp. Of14-4]MCG7489428.1 DNA polymerase III subunit delta' [Vibrio sp. Of14-4]
MISTYPWLSSIWQEWQSSLEQDTFPNAVLLNSHQGLATEALISSFAQALMCSNYVSEACGICHSCQLMQASNHPDYHLIKPEKSAKSISVDQIRGCNRLAQESSQLSGKRIFIIEPAEAMTESAANALLKTLEEPSGTCMFLLISYQPHLLLPTVSSRCQRWQVTKPSAHEVSDWLSEKVSVNIPPHIAHVNGNAPTTIQLFLDKGQEALYQQIELGLLDVLKNRGDMIALAKQLASSHEESLNWVWYILTDAQKLHFGLDAPYFSPIAKELIHYLSYEKLFQQTENLSNLKQQLREYPGLNSELLILDWLIKFNEEVCS